MAEPDEAAAPATGSEQVFERYVFRGREAPSQANTYILVDPSGAGGKAYYWTVDGELPPMKFLHYTIRKRGRARPRISIEPMQPEGPGFLAEVVLSDPTVVNTYGENVALELMRETKSDSLAGPEMLEYVRKKMRSGTYQSGWKDMLMTTRAAFYFFPEVLQMPLEYAPQCADTIFLFSYRQLHAYYLCIHKYPESACFAPIMKRCIKKLSAELSSSARDSNGREKHRLPEMDAEQWRRFSTEQRAQLDKLYDRRESTDWMQPFFVRAVEIYSSVLMKLLRDCRNTFVTESMIARKMNWANGTEGVRAREAIGFLRSNDIVTIVPRRDPDHPLYDAESDSEERYALNWVHTVERYNHEKLQQLRSSGGDFVSCVADAIRKRSATYRMYWGDRTLERDSGPFGPILNRDKKPCGPDSDQKRCLEIVLANPASMVSGPPGTGKSFVTALLVRMLLETFYEHEDIKSGKERPVRVEIVTPTARAAGALRRQLVQVGVSLENYQQDISTIAYGFFAVSLVVLSLRCSCFFDPPHRYHVTYYRHLRDTSQQKKPGGAASAAKRVKPETTGGADPEAASRAEKLARYSNTQILVVDEVSQIDSQLCSDMLHTFPGVQMLVLVGDLDQNFPVAWGKPFHDIVPLLKRTGCAFFLETYHRTMGTLESAVRSMRHCDLDFIFKNTSHFTRVKDGEFRCIDGRADAPLVAVDAGRTVATNNWANPERNTALIKYVEDAALFVVKEIFKGDGGRESQFCTYNNNECEAINRVCKLYYHRQANTYEAKTMEKWPLMHLHRGDKVMLLQNRRDCFEAASPTFLRRPDEIVKLEKEPPVKKGPAKSGYDRLKRGQKHVRAAMNGHSGWIVDVYVHYHNEKSGEERMADVTQRRFTSTDAYGLRQFETLVLVIKLEGLDETYLHVSMKDYRRRDIVHAWAISAYRAQGSEWPRVCYVCSNQHIDDPEKLALVTKYPTRPTYESRRTSYVALSRARQQCVMLFTNNYRDKLETLLREKEVMYASVFSSLLDDELRKLDLQHTTSDDPAEAISDELLVAAADEAERGLKRKAEEEEVIEF